MITIDASFWASVGVDSSDGNANGNQKDFYNSMVVNGVTIYNQKEFFENSTVNGIVYYNQFDWYRAIGTFYSEPIYDQYSFYQNVTFDGVNAVGNQKDFFEFILGIRYFTTLQSASSQYYTIPSVILTGDFNIKAKFSITTSNGVILGSATDTSNFLRVLNDTTIDMRIGGVTISTWTTSGLLDGKLHDIELQRTSGIVEIFIDGVSIGTNTDADNFTISQIGGYNTTTSLFNGVISDVNINNGQRIYKINEDLSGTSTIIDYGSDGSNGTAVSITSSELFTLEGADWIGAELVTNGNFATDLSSWVITGEDATHSITWDNGSALYLSDTTSPF